MSVCPTHQAVMCHSAPPRGCDKGVVLIDMSVMPHAMSVILQAMCDMCDRLSFVVVLRPPVCWARVIGCHLS